LKSAQQKVEQLIEENGELRTEAFEPEGMQVVKHIYDGFKLLTTHKKRVIIVGG